MKNKMYGFTFFLRGKDYFVETSQTRKTRKLAEKILPLVGLSVNPSVIDGNINALLFKMKPAVCEIKIAANSTRTEKRYYDISGDGFGGCGSWINDGSTIVLQLD